MFLYVARLVRPVRDDIKRALSSHITKIVDDLFESRRRNSQQNTNTQSFSTQNEPVIMIEYYPHYTDESFELEDGVHLSSPITHTSPHQDEHQNNDDNYDGGDTQEDSLSDNSVPDIHSRPSSYIETPIYQSPKGSRRIIDYEEYCENNPHNLSIAQWGDRYKSAPIDDTPHNHDDEITQEIEEEDTFETRMRRFEEEYSDDDADPNEDTDDKLNRLRHVWETVYNQPRKRKLDDIISPDSTDSVPSDKKNKADNDSTLACPAPEQELISPAAARPFEPNYTVTRPDS